MFLLGLDIGSSSIKAALVNAETGAVAGVSTAPEQEMSMLAQQPGWAEQYPDAWWDNCRLAIHKVMQQTGAAPDTISAIGLSYQMHGLVIVDNAGEVLRPAIIWCDSRAVGIGDAAFQALGKDFCQAHYLNAPGNFTASKLKWVRENEPDLFARVHKILLPGDYIAFRMTGEMRTTVSGLSEGILWDFVNNDIARHLLDHYGFDEDLIPRIAPTFGIQGLLSAAAAGALGLRSGIPVAYRAGDQPNNALALNVLEPGEVAATGGTSGVVYGVVDRLAHDPQNRVNSFAHVNHRPEAPRIGVLLCINGAGILHRWMRQQVADGSASYADLERLAATVPPGSDGLQIQPFGNGAERMLGNHAPGAKVLNLHFNRHTRAHLIRAALEGIAFSFAHGMGIMKGLGLDVSVIRVGNDNLFQSAVFAQTIAELMDCRIEVLRTTGATGAAIGAGAGIGLWPEVRAGLQALALVQEYGPEGQSEALEAAYAAWEQALI